MYQYIIFKQLKALSQLSICRPLSPPSLRNDHIVMKPAQCAETNEKSIFLFLFFELLLILYSKFTESSDSHLINRSRMSTFFHPKRCAMFETNAKQNFRFFAIFSF